MSACAKDKYVMLGKMKLDLDREREYGLSRLVRDRMDGVARWLDNDEMKQAAIDIANYHTELWG